MKPAARILSVIVCCILWSEFDQPTAIGQSSDDKDTELQAIQTQRIERNFDQADKLIAQAKRGLEAKDFAKQVLLELELLKSKSARAFEEKADSRFESYQSVIAIADRFVSQNGSNPNLILVDVQKAMTALKFGELLRMEVEAGKLGSGTMGSRKVEEGFKLLRIADRELDAIDQKLNLMIPSQPRKTVNGKLNQRQLISLQNQVRYQRVKTKINRGLLYGTNDPDNRVSVISTARNDLEKVIPMIEKVDPSWWTSRLDLVICLREVGDYRECQQLFRSYPINEASPQIQLAFRAEAIRLALELKDLKTAERVLALGREVDGQTSPNFDFAVLEYLIKKNQSGGSQNPNEMQDELVKVVQAIEKQHGAYWGRKANLAVVASARVTGSGGSTTLIRVAQDFYRQKKFLESIEQFEKAAQAARQELNRRLELELLFQVIVIHRQLGEHKTVVEKCSELTRRFKSTNRAATVSLVGIQSAAELVRTGEFKIDQYLAILDYHLKTWQHHPSVGKVAFYRAEYDFSQKDYAAAALFYKASMVAMINTPGAIDLDSFENSMSGLIKAFENWSPKTDVGNKVNDFRKEFSGSDFFDAVREKTGDLESTLNGWAVYVLEFEPTESKNVFETLFGEQKPTGKLLQNLIRAAVLSEQLTRVADLDNRLASLEKEFVEGMLRSFVGDWESRDQGVRKGVAQVVSRLKLDESLTRRHWKILALSYLEKGQNDSAIKCLRLIVSQDSKSLEPRVMLARTLCQSDEKKDIELGLDAWRAIVGRSRPQSDSWYESKLEIARCHYRLKDVTKARSILDVMNAIPPGWNETKHKEEFEKLYRQLKSIR